MTLRLAIRGYGKGGVRVFEDFVDTEDDTELEGLCQKHMERLKDHPKHMIEIEFLDERDPNQRFFRFGTDPSGMVVPIAYKL